MATLPEAIYKFKAMPLQNVNIILLELEWTILGFIIKHKETRT
jgi:hypothetical protein